jgi:hypothetical protein
MDTQTPTPTLEPRPFPWTARKLDAARLVAEDSLSDQRIAAQVGIERRQLTRWKSVPQFMAKVEAIVAALGERSLRFAVARRHRRVKAQNDRWRKMKRVMRERAAALEMANVPGGKTGLLVRKVKSIGGGESAREVEEYEVDTGLLKEIRDLEKQVAQEVGQWEAGKGDDRPNVNLNVGGSVNVVAVKQFANLTLAERLRIGLQAGGVPAEDRGGGHGRNGPGDDTLPG